MTRAVVFDLGGVLIDWNPRHLYRKLLPDDASVEAFLAEVCTADWNYQQDAGRAVADAVAEVSARHPERAELIAAYYERFEEMLGGPIEESVAVVAELAAAGVPLYALTNWSRETFPIARRRFDFLQRFRGIVVSGEERAAKPDPRIYQILLERYRLDPASCLFIDDVARNAEGARAAGMQAIVYTSPGQLRRELAARSILAQ
ncbi:MAG TPA: HAD family phosphatase [Kofleriaceae bacterium]|nr:HAD family phosphatase [Kofleriaceae bacterium]